METVDIDFYLEFSPSPLVHVKAGSARRYPLSAMKVHLSRQT